MQTTTESSTLVSLHRWLLWVFLLSLLLAGGCSPAAKKARHLARGEKFFKAEQYDRAEIEFLNVLRLERTNAVALRQLGLGSYQQGRLIRSYQFLTQALALRSEDDEVRLRLASILITSRNFKEAREHAEAVLSRHPANEEALMMLSDTAFSASDIQAVRRRIETSRPRLEGKPALHLVLGALELRQLHTNEALAHFERALALDPQSSDAHFELGNVSVLSTNSAKADFHFRRAAELAPVRSARRIHYADFKLHGGDLVAAKTFLESMIKQAPDFIPARTRLAEIASIERRFDDATSISRNILARDPGNYETMLLLGRVSLSKGDYPQARVEFGRLVAAYPRVAQAHFHLAVAHMMNKDQVKAIATLQQAIAIEPKDTDSILLLAELNIRKNDLPPAVASLKQLVKEQPQLAQAHLLLGTACRAQRQFDAAAAVYENMAGIFPRNPQPRFLLGQVLLSQQKKDDARKNFEAALQIAPGFLLALDELVDLDLADKQFAAIKARVARYIDQQPKSPALYVLLARIHSAENNPVAAEEALSRAIAVDPEYQPAYLALARVYEASNRLQLALDKLNAAAVKSPNNATLMLIAMIHTRMTNYTTARETYDKLLAADPRFVPALNNLAYLCSEHLNLPDKAFEYARAARNFAPADPVSADTLGWIVFKRGEYPWALTLLQESAEKLPKESEVLFHLGMTHYMLGDEPPARMALQNALQSGKDFPGRTEAQKRLTFLSEFTSSTNLVALEQQLAIDPRDPFLLVRVATLYEQTGAAEKAAQAYTQALQYNPKNIPVMLKLAQLYAGPLRNPSKALEIARDARALAAEDPNVSLILGRLAFQAGDYEWSLGLLQESARSLPNNPDLLYDLAWASYSMGRLSDADAAMKRALGTGKQFDRSADAKRFIELNALALNPDQIAASVPQADSALKQDPGYVPALFASALANERSGNGSAARPAYDLVLKRFPDFAPAHKRLAVLLSSSTADRDAALQHATKARNTFPDDSEVARALGILTFHRKEYSRAAQLLKEVCRKQPNDAEAYYYLGLAKFHLKDKNESRLALQRALSLNSNATFATDAKRVIAELN